MKLEWISSVWILLILSSFLFAEPYLAVREGLRCSSCHENLTGGGKRNRFGANYGAQALPWKDLSDSRERIPNYLEILENRISIGADFRASHISTFVDGGPNANTFQLEKSDIYLRFELIQDFVTFYLDESVAPGGTQAREVFGLLNIPHDGWLKMGKFVPPYGFRLEDDRSFIREVTGFNFNQSELGIEFGIEPGRFTMEAAFTNGTGGLDDNNSKQLIGTFGYVHDRFRLGVSASYNPGESADQTIAGVWGGATWRRFVLLGELDAIRDDNETTVHQLVSYLELNCLIIQGWTVKAAYEYHDPNRDISENQRDRVLLGFEFTPIPFVQIQAFYRFNQSIPQNQQQNADELQLRLHLFF